MNMRSVVQKITFGWALVTGVPLAYSPLSFAECSDSERVTINISDVNVYQYDYIGVGGTIHYFTSPDNAFDEPVVIVEGLDISNNIGCDYLFKKLEKNHLIISALQAEGKDVVIVNFDDSTIEIEKNALFLEKVIESINSKKEGRHSNVVVGLSMGGLVARYALTRMEELNKTHDTFLFLTYDTPHKFANISTNLQSFITFDESTPNATLNKPAVRQMLITRGSVYTDDGTYFDAVDYNFQLRSKLSAIGDYPNKLTKVAFANGSALGLNGAYGFDVGDSLVTVEWLRFSLAGEEYTIDVNITAVGPNEVFAYIDCLDEIGLSFGYEGEYVSPPVTLGCKGASYFTLQARVDPDEPVISYDNAPGSYSDNIYSAIIGEITSRGYPVDVNEEHVSFIPTISSLDIATEDLFYDIQSQVLAGRIAKITPFDEIYYPSNGRNEAHLEITDEKRAQILSVIDKYQVSLDGDSDSDGMSNSTEADYGSDMFRADTDGDLMSDGFEYAAGLNVQSLTDLEGAAERDGDLDGDEVSNYREYCGTLDDTDNCSGAFRSDPTQAASTPASMRAAVLATIAHLLN